MSKSFSPSAQFLGEKERSLRVRLEPSAALIGQKQEHSHANLQKRSRTIRISSGFFRHQMRPGGINSEMRANAALARVTGGILHSEPAAYSNITDAFQQNERMVKRAQADYERYVQRESLIQRAYSSQYHNSSAGSATTRWNEQQQAEWENKRNAGSTITSALAEIDRLYGPQKPSSTPSMARTHQIQPSTGRLQRLLNASTIAV